MTLKVRIVLFLTFNSKMTKSTKLYYGHIRSTLALLINNQTQLLAEKNFGNTKQHRYLGYKVELSVKLHEA